MYKILCTQICRGLAVSFRNYILHIQFSVLWYCLSNYCFWIVLKLTNPAPILIHVSFVEIVSSAPKTSRGAQIRFDTPTHTWAQRESWRRPLPPLKSVSIQSSDIVTMDDYKLFQIIGLLWDALSIVPIICYLIWNINIIWFAVIVFFLCKVLNMWHFITIAWCTSFIILSWWIVICMSW
jgi:hypothetical protein